MKLGKKNKKKNIVSIEITDDKIMLYRKKFDNNGNPLKADSLTIINDGLMETGPYAESIEVIDHFIDKIVATASKKMRDKLYNGVPFEGTLKGTHWRPDGNYEDLSKDSDTSEFLAKYEGKGSDNAPMEELIEGSKE